MSPRKYKLNAINEYLYYIWWYIIIKPRDSTNWVENLFSVETNRSENGSMQAQQLEKSNIPSTSFRFYANLIHFWILWFFDWSCDHIAYFQITYWRFALYLSFILLLWNLSIFIFWQSLTRLAEDSLWI